jgi:hypothetical protein
MANRPTFKVYMLDNNGNVWEEEAYEGYGEFGGKDFYELLAQMNGLDANRSAGIDLAFSGKKYFSPNLVENLGAWKWVAMPPENCPDQGYFYSSEDDSYNAWEETDDDWDPEYVEEQNEDSLGDYEDDPEDQANIHHI